MKITNICFFIALVAWMGCQSSADSGSPSDISAGKGGSMARFTLSGDHLYALSGSSLRIFNITDPAQPVDVNTKTIGSGFGVETIFAYKDKLFFGTTTGMLIYDNSTPNDPQFISSVFHFTACDPVVVEDSFAYVTIRNGTGCRWAQNVLLVVDISDITMPITVATYPMFNPHGLGIDKGKLFVCDGAAGLKVFDATNPFNLIQKASYPNIHAFDVIPLNNLLVMTGDDGIYQYNYKSIDSVRFVSKIEVGL